MKFALFVLTISMALTIISHHSVFAQKDTLITKLDSLSKKTDSIGGQRNNTNPTAYNEQTKLSFKSYFSLLGSDLKQAFTKPVHMSRKDWVRFGGFTGITLGFMLIDPSIQKFTLDASNDNPDIKKISDRITTFGGVGEVVVLTFMGGYGVLFKKRKDGDYYATGHTGLHNRGRS